MALPVCLLWKVNLQLRQKLFLGAFFCLNILMVITALIRATGLKAKISFDEPWVFLWMQLEASTAVLLISVTAFRSVFAPGGLRKPKTLLKAWYSFRARTFGKQNKDDLNGDEMGMDRCPDLPLANLTGTHTDIQGGHFGARPASGHDEFDDYSTYESSQRIKVSHTLSHQVHIVSGNHKHLFLLRWQLTCPQMPSNPDENE